MSVVEQQMQLRLAARAAAGDLVHAAREFLGASTRLAEAAKRWDPTGQYEDAMLLGAAETVADLLTLAAHAAPGIRQLLAQALEATQPEAPAPAASAEEG